ncbi:hypothetical protein EJ08DRAFT_77748 [Tothia fuscella]|uniref:Uncharacterized protein n=1 Tax=Tothia fuscella TaxID=1048955 RepID=A0A9P4NW38_9PEZI|nr:hypothetical protein EJ08DRAFT_77748 [Tothia fuscella]
MHVPWSTFKGLAAFVRSCPRLQILGLAAPYRCESGALANTHIGNSGFNYSLGNLSDFSRFQSAISRNTEWLETLHILNWPAIDTTNPLLHHNHQVAKHIRNTCKGMLRDQAAALYELYEGHRKYPTITFGLNELHSPFWPGVLCFHKVVYRSAANSEIVIAQHVRYRDLLNDGLAVEMLEPVDFHDKTRRERYRLPFRHDDDEFEEEVMGFTPVTWGSGPFGR